MVDYHKISENTLTKLFLYVYILTNCNSCRKTEIPVSGQNAERPKSGRPRTDNVKHAISEKEMVKNKTYYNFGNLITTGNTIHHKFNIANTESQNIHIIDAFAYTQCCSSITVDQKILKAGEIATASVSFETGRRSGHQQLHFSVITDSKTRPREILTLEGELIQDWEVETPDGGVGTLPIGREAEKTLRVLCRRNKSQGRSVAYQIKAEGRLAISFQGPRTEIERGGIVESFQEIRVHIPPSKEIGQKRGQLLFQWEDQTTKSYAFGWEVTPLVKLAPSGFIIDSLEETQKTVVLTSTDTAVKILQISGNILVNQVQTDVTSKKIHVIKLTLKANSDMKGAAHDIIILTNHPDQPIVKLSLLVLIPNA